jgi:hypothetical protein
MILCSIVGGYQCFGRSLYKYNILDEKPEEIRPFHRPGHTQEDNIKVDLKEIYLEGVDL